ncbi:Queuosine biosynthesis protein [Rubrobacter xylanophilus DSM 9941]|uniref:S-adenosylmethionine:tRNA ribosyltransferase-isomerase n=1 Tax=Rubrobacter xylanophilus (strain DSM 9941 / JCM 11954 / NBRC 16129 / PRD-1) TaxID=266117 RepID=QUEA_RUBXD|nr:tRNA preQ1(34) S-adenosylmethionine ribosyltransferase-isomerase QueA [Rubrobacter xylanophilus]Q1AWD5.1 RecName: Full=S-adenosylmethionine:tRNA ribosyltransferase-isomerase; AltName: Full=Queuosine biosynthesis protein QueA [Rubrobacter xylanophilus DSM 9941]ABG04293.1 Queuosine biosynthesis protein [Rubrobacter xylanophilus DSM 9941]
MRTDELDYELPQELIAQRPAEPRDASRLMVVDVPSRGISHHVFRELPRFLGPGDVLVLNETKVIPARLFASRPGGGEVELLFLGERGGAWEALARPSRRLRPGMPLSAGEGERLEVVEELGEGRWLVRGRDVPGLLERAGRMPLPPYIEPTPEAEASYQTVYARTPGSAAAPTAGFHFTGRVLRGVEEAGARIARVVLHVGLGTFAPVREERLEDHRMHREYYAVPEETARAVEEAERVVAVGTTVVRTLESWARSGVREGESELFIYPGYEWRAVDALITNFHLPRSTLLALVMSFAGRELVREAYEVAVRERYRFYSFGDAMLLLGGGRSLR